MTTRETFHRTWTLSVLLLGTTLVAAGCEDDPAEPDPPDEIEQLVSTVRTATEAYQSEPAAAAAGYAAASPCVASPDGGMGVHYANAALMDGTVAASEPELLLYEPDAGGGMTLIGVEFMVIADAWDASNSAPPTLAGTSFDDHRAEDARHGLPFPHYDLHVWAWRENPSGVFAPFNPTVSCP